MTTIASEIDLEPLSSDTLDGPPLLKSALPFLGKVKVDVQVCVGNTSVSVQHLLSLQNGSVIELDRLVEHPVDVVVEGHVIARGILVAVGEHFGVRVSETVIPSVHG